MGVNEGLRYPTDFSTWTSLVSFTAGGAKFVGSKLRLLEGLPFPTTWKECPVEPFWIYLTFSDPLSAARVNEALAGRTWKGRQLQSHHFETLRAAGIIESRSEGVKCLSSLREKELNQRFPGLLDLIAAEG